MFSVGIITSSDKGFKGERTDLSGPIIAELVEAKGYKIIRQIIVFFIPGVNMSRFLYHSVLTYQLLIFEKTL
jgi:hypothetical protein